MNAKQLFDLLRDHPGAFDIVIQGRGQRARLSRTVVEDSYMGPGWRIIADIQNPLGHKRVTWDGHP